MNKQEETEETLVRIQTGIKDGFYFKGHFFKGDSGIECLDKTEVNGYTDFIELFHNDKTWFTTEEGDYQGEWYALGEKEGVYYYHQGSYGSCSGCDWLQGISGDETALEFLKAMDKIIKIGNKEEAIIYLKKETKNLWDDAKGAIKQLIEHIENG